VLPNDPPQCKRPDPKHKASLFIMGVTLLERF
jgi:hypothetical protein